MKKKMKKKPGSTFTKKLTQGPNKGDTVTFRVARGGKPYPVRVVKDIGSKNKSRVAKRQRKKK